MLSLAIFGNSSQPTSRLDAIASFFNNLASRDNLRAVVEKSFMDYLQSLSIDIPVFDTFDTLPQGSTMAISMGGDGTFLSTARAVGDNGTPIVGINTGHLGFLADADIADAGRLLDSIIAADYRIEPRSVLKAEILSEDANNKPTSFALNEVAILRDDTASMIDVHTSINAIPLADYRGDGLIVATPTGSTGYNLSVGGPIIEPVAPALSIAPIAPHSLSMRPLVVSDSTVIDISISSRAPSWRLSLDGHWISLPLSSRVRITRASFNINIVHTRSHTFASTLRSKLLWGAPSF